MLSGPSALGSVKPGYEYSDTYTWPSDTLFSNTSFNDSYFLFSNLAPGTYQYVVFDDCGHEIIKSFTITPQQVTKLSRKAIVKKGCLGENKIIFSIITRGIVNIKDLSNNSIIKTKEFLQSGLQDSVLHVPSGQYEITYNYAPNSNNPLNDSVHNCWVIHDTITIPPYAAPEMSTGNVIMCNDIVNFVLVPDSTKGVPPYQYEIIAGPQTFPIQNSNLFTISEPGTYLARIFDVCGNASTKQITADTIAFDPIQMQSTCNNTNLTLPSSIYFTYEWLKPNGQTYVGNSLLINPITTADTGTYQISKIININGCTDTLQASYHVGLLNYSEQLISLCPNTSLTIGSHIYNSPGIYYDTLVNALGCDSIVKTTLEIPPQIVDTNQVNICLGDSLEIGNQYYSANGFYIDSAQNTLGCYNLTVTQLHIVQPKDTVIASICQGESYTFGGNTLSLAGDYTDTLISVLGCDSIVTLQLSLTPYSQNTITTTICFGENYPFAGNSIHNSGTYIDTVFNSSCGVVTTLNLLVLPPIIHTLSATICYGEVYQFGTNSINQSGVYIDTISTATCDSIVSLTLNVKPSKDYSIYQVICTGDEYLFNGTPHSQSGIYSFIFTSDGCDSLVTLHLAVTPTPTVQIISSAYETNEGTIVQLDAISSVSPLSYLWTSSSILSNYTIRKPTTLIQNPSWVTVTVTDTNGCIASSQLHVEIPITSTLYIPNSVTPDGNESNPVFKAYGTNIVEFHILIFNRWGEIIFESYDMSIGWDGTYKERIVQDGTYVYKVYAVGSDNVIYNKTGHIAVIK